MLRALLPIALALALGCGCYGEVDHHTTGYGNTPPTLVYIAPEVQAVADNPYPVFFAGGSYWQCAGERSQYREAVGLRPLPPDRLGSAGDRVQPTVGSPTFRAQLSLAVARQTR
jgi:hypothetical protein